MKKRSGSRCSARFRQDQIRLQILKQRYREFSKAAGLPEQHERLEKAGLTWKHGRAAERVSNKGIANQKTPSYNIHKLDYAGQTTPELECGFEESISKIPFMHRELAETKITGIEITDSDIGSWYSRRTGKICLSKKVYPDTAIHEYAHAQSDAVGAYDDPRFRAVLRKGLENISPADVIYDEKNILLDSMLDYFSEGYEEYIRNPDNLMLHDPDLFVYFEGII